ncbi:Lactate dehydrogenase [Seinonella peptonophila]|uniref:Lactate dehydrogenase n=1 Tax=Seinonella peptonophila TaxID=112248 RepID=A0A1M5BAT8_9BACL|nr:NAD(P)-dependent oxidoreductase [Seinonella peptonophila]SHF39623.1 Lactate dehydrogenase [Seinonella peptonophila]
MPDSSFQYPFGLTKHEATALAGLLLGKRPHHWDTTKLLNEALKVSKRLKSDIDKPEYQNAIDHLKSVFENTSTNRNLEVEHSEYQKDMIRSNLATLAPLFSLLKNSGEFQLLIAHAKYYRSSSYNRAGIKSAIQLSKWIDLNFTDDVELTPDMIPQIQEIYSNLNRSVLNDLKELVLSNQNNDELLSVFKQLTEKRGAWSFIDDIIRGNELLSNRAWIEHYQKQIDQFVPTKPHFHPLAYLRNPKLNLPKEVLVTGDLFMSPEHFKKLEDNGIHVNRLEKNEPTTEELCEAIQGMDGYILGGIEQVTEEVVNAADRLKSIVFPGIGYKGFIPAWEYATHKGITIANTPSTPTNAVAEWMIGASLAMNRGFFDLMRGSQTTFKTTPGLENQTIGIIGLGRIGKRLAEMLSVFEPDQIAYYSTHQHPDVEIQLGIQRKENIIKLLEESDVVCLCISDDHENMNFFTSFHFDHMKPGSLLTTATHPGVVDLEALYRALKSGKIRAASDYPADSRFDEFRLAEWFSFNKSNAFNTESMIKHTSDQATEKMVNLLIRGYDPDIVNPRAISFLNTWPQDSRQIGVKSISEKRVPIVPGRLASALQNPDKRDSVIAFTNPERYK